MSGGKLIIGAGGGGGKGGGGGGSGRVAVESPDNLRSKAYANVLDLICEGEIEGLADGAKSIYFNETPLQNADGSFNFSNVTWDTRNGTQSQGYIAGVPSVESEVSVGTEVKYGVPVTRTVSNGNVNAVRVTVSVPTLTYQNTSNGDLSGTSVAYKIQVQSNGGGFVDQIAGRETIDLGAGAIIGTSQPLYAASLNLTWAGDSTPTNQTVTYSVQSSKNGGAWVEIGTGTWSGTVNNWTITDPWSGEVSGSGTDYPSNSTTITPSVDGSAYQFRVVKVSGYGTLTLSGTGTAGTATITISGKTTTQYQRSHRFTLTGSAPWDIKLVRLTADSTSTAVQNKTYLANYTEIIDAKLRYPNSALVGLRVDSSQFQNIPSRAYDMKLLKVRVPSNYDPVSRNYTGTWDGTFKIAWTDNPAWCFYDLVTAERYGLGSYIDESQVDKWSLYSIGQYCDERVPNGFGGVEPRFTCNIYIQTRAEAYKVVQDMASTFRAMAYWASGSLTLAQDAPSDPKALFTQANVVDGVFSYSGSSSKARHTVALVTWNDPADFYRQKVEYVEDADAIARFGVVTTEVVAVGCTSRGQAHRVGRWLLYSERNEAETVAFRTGLEGAIARPGEIIKVADSSRAGARLGGRVSDATTTTITLDNAVTLGSAAWTMYVMLPDGTVGSSEVSSAAGAVVTLATPLAAVPQRHATWVMSTVAVEAQTFRVLSVMEQGEGVMSITALKHEPDKYNAIEFGYTLEPRKFTSLTTKPDAPTNGSVTEYLYNALTDVKTMALFSWEAPTNVIGCTYEVLYRVGDGNFTMLTSSTPNVQLSDAQPGVYTISVRAVSPTLIYSMPYSYTATVEGKTARPSDVTGLQMTVQGSTGLLQWNNHPDLDVRIGGQIQIRYSEQLDGALWNTALPIADFPGSATSGSVPLRAGSYLAKAVDSTGNTSIVAALVTTNAVNIDQFNAVATSVQHPTFAGAKTDLVVVDSKLMLDGEVYIDSIADFDAEPYTMDGNLVASGTYEFDDYIDTGAVYTSRVTASFTLNTYNTDTFLDYNSAEFVDNWADVDTIPVWDTPNEVDNAYLRVYIATTSDNPAASPVWSDWRLFYVGDYTARAYKFKAVLSRGEAVSNQVAVETLSVTVDVPDRVEAAEDVAVPAGGLTVSFANAFYSIPAVALTGQNMATGDFYQVTAKTKYGFTIQFKNSAGVGVARTMDWIAKGFGYLN